MLEGGVKRIMLSAWEDGPNGTNVKIAGSRTSKGTENQRGDTGGRPLADRKQQCPRAM